MKLTRAYIVNFRSIKDATVVFDPSCRVLVGINESGKSNVLRALRLLGDDFVPKKADDVREGLPTEATVAQSVVRFLFRLTKDEIDEVFDAMHARIVCTADDPHVAQIGNTRVGLRRFCEQRNSAWYVVDVAKETKSLRASVLEAGITLRGAWSKPSAACPVDFQLSFNDGTKVKLKECALIRRSDVPDVPEAYFSDADIDDLAAAVNAETLKVAKANLPSVLYWEYSDKYLLPPEVSMDTFAAEPGSCEPLWNMFVLAGHTKVKDELARVRQQSSNQIQNFLDRVAAKTTRHFRSVWKDYKDIEFILRHESGKIVPGIKEKNSFDFAKRSDGFKRFVTFLLMISADVETGNLTDTLLLIDEPDVSLHPSGSRYLRDELIRISSSNYVVYSTHSIFMVDTGGIDRHYLVRKKNEITTIEPAGESNVADEEVLYNALGFSMFEILKERNIIFEGWKDKKLFLTALSGASTQLKRAFRDVGLCHARGAKNIRTVTPMIELGRRACLIVSDSDAAAQEQKRIYQRDRGFGTWKTYQDLDASLVAVTGEDFVKNNRIKTCVNEAISELSLPAFLDTDLPAATGKLKAIDSWLRTKGLTAEQAKDVVAQTKDAIFTDLEPRHIEDEYTKLLRALSTA